jgi:hypothetical protein
VSVAVASVTRGLREAGAAFGPLAGPEPGLRWGLLFDELDGADDADYVRAVELIYEGYLFHYRQSRVCAGVEGACRENALLAGDCLYARGLYVIAARGDAAAVGLLARLMAACSYLRSVRAPFAADDALWAYAVGGLAALRQGVAPGRTVLLFEAFDEAHAEGVAVDVTAAARDRVRSLGLRDAAPLVRALEALPPGRAA